MSVNIVVPEMGESIVDARIARWLKKEGDAVAAGEPLVELETDKVESRCRRRKNGVLERIAHDDGADVKIGEVLGTIAEGAGAVGVRGRRRRSAAAAASAKTERRRPSPATPSARKAAREQNVELGHVQADGPRVTKADVEKRAQRPRPTKAAPAAGRRRQARCASRAASRAAAAEARRARRRSRRRPHAKSACACRSAARRSRSGSSRRSRPRRCSRPSTRST